MATDVKKKSRRRDSEPSLTRSFIIETAIKIIDRDGTEAFSMRNLAKELNVYPTAIYWHIANRNMLIGAVIDTLLVDLVPEDFEEDWQQGIIGLCRNYRQRIKLHPNIAPLIGSQLVSNTSLDFRMIERILAALEKAGFKGNNLRAAYNTVIAAMVGYTTQEFSLVPPDGKEKWSESIRTAIEDVDEDQYPTISDNLDQLKNQSFIMRWENGTTSSLDDGFELFVNSIVTGLASTLNELN